MEKPYVMVHMMMTVDGRIDCPVVDKVSGEEYYLALDKLGHCSKLSGKVTAALENPAVKGVAEVTTSETVGEESVYVAAESDEYTIVVDTNGCLLWQANEADGHPLLCIMSENVTAEHLKELREMGISWIVTGKSRIDLARAMQLAYERFSVERVAVVGGGHICGGFLAAGLVDEVSVMVAPGIDGRKGQTAVFDGIVKDSAIPYKLKLKSVEQWEGTEVIWIRYAVKQ